MIVSSIDSPLHEFASYLHNIMYKSFPKREGQVVNSFQFVRALTNLRINCSNPRLISLDVISLFTNIPLQNAIESVSNRWDLIADNTQIPRDEFLRAVDYVLKSTVFTFNNNVYEQTYGTPMGSPHYPRL